MDTLGSLIDKLATVDLKMFNAQDEFYLIRAMTFEQFVENYFSSPENCKKLYNLFQKGIDLNLQRNQLIDEVDGMILSLVKDAISGEDLSKYLQLKHKTYNYKKSE